MREPVADGTAARKLEPAATARRSGEANFDRLLVARIPKVQLHCHLEGTVSAGTFRDLAALRGVVSARANGPLEGTYVFATFGEFLLTFAEVCKTLQCPADYARVATEYAKDAAAQNVRYAELFISPSVWKFFHPELDVVACVKAMREALTVAERQRGPIVRFICDLTRNFGTERAFQTARLAVQLAESDGGVIGIGLGGDEANFPAALYAEPFSFARAHGLHTVAHAGEAAGAQSVRDAVMILGAERIGHGVRALEDDRVVDMLARRGIALECAPTSNARTGIVDAQAVHPLVALDERGVVVTVDADDPALFGTSITRELELVGETVGTHDMVRFVRNAVDASFAEPTRKSALQLELDAALES
ncbi:MAG: adenosine deaminase [Candidatus Eremiobacteraeota bacterium]|nr:adenosine deaminase [Candidatus Eremiobacteraeota bacterium]